MPAEIRLGCQGWNYTAWVGPLYPSKTKSQNFLSTYARAFSAVEVDSTFYAVPAANTVRSWAERTPEQFVFALKLPQEITHELRLRHAGDVLQRFTDVARELGPKLGPILIQMGPDFTPSEVDALAEFLATLPRDLDFAIEFRQRGWATDATLALLTAHRVALALADARWIPRKTMLALAARPTADFAYVRWMGPDRSIVDYSRVQVDRTAELEQWAAVLPTLTAKVRVAYGFVNNHFAGHSPASVRELQRLLGQAVVDPSALGEQLPLL